MGNTNNNAAAKSQLIESEQLTSPRSHAGNTATVLAQKFGCIAWICANQLHKHNMTETQRMKLLHEEFEARRHTVGAADGFRGNQHTKVVNEQNARLPENAGDTRNKLRKAIAQEHRISERAMQTAVEVGRGIDRATKDGE